MITSLPLPEYRPDQTVASGVLLVAENVFPAIDGYRPARDISVFTDALPGEFMGVYSAIASDGDAFLLAGTSDALYRMGSGGVWTELADTLTVPYRWQFAQFGDYALGVNGGTMQEVALLTSTASDVATAPAANSIAVVGDHVVLGQAGGDLSRVAWSAFRDHTGWTVGTDQAGDVPMQTGGTVMGVVGGEYGIILQRERITRMTRTGDASAPFQFDEVSNNYGCSSGATIAQAGRTVFFLSDRGFMALEDGQALRPIGSEKVDRTFAEYVSRDDLGEIYTAVDPQNKVVVWGVPGTPGTMWIYNFELDRWTTAVFPFRGVFSGFTTSIGLEALDAIYTTGIDLMDVSLDDARFSGGAPRLYAVAPDMKLGTLTGDTLAARMDMGFAEIAKGHRARVRGIRPICDAIDGVSVVLNAKQRLGDADATTVTADLRYTGNMPVRVSGRFISHSLRIAAGTLWSYAQGLEVSFEVGGRK